MGDSGGNAGWEIVIGYGTSHDAGMCVVERATGRPLFAASRERLSRVKTDSANPMVLLGWVERALGPGFTAWEIPVIQDERYFRASCGFHAAEPSSKPFDRWTAREAWIETDPKEDFRQVLIRAVPASVCHRRLRAEVLINGESRGILDNRRGFLLVDSLDGGPVHEVRFRCFQELRCPPDPRTLGILIQSVQFRRGRPGRASVASHATSEAHNFSNFSRLVRKQFFVLPAKGLRRARLVKTAVRVTHQLRLLAAGYSTHSERILGREHYCIGSRYDHHWCHAATAYYPSGQAKSLVVSLDGMGDEYSCRVFRGEEGFLSPVAAYYYEEMPTGLNYEIITTMLGFNPERHAGKITGLAAFGRENPACKEALDEFFDEVWKRGRSNSTGNFDDYMRAGRIGPGHAGLHELRQSRFGAFSREDIARYIQDRTEREGCALIARHWKENPDLDTISLAGGVFANVKLNQRVKELGFREIFIQPAMSDAGICFGAALLECAKKNGGRLDPFRLHDVFLGPGFTRDEITEAMKRAGLSGEWIDDEKELAGRVARLIAEKKVVAHFDGRMEYGPRALGNRSILYSAHNPSVNQWLNKQLRRTEFMPFAPAVLWEHADEYFENIAGAEYTAEFMTITFNCKERARREIPAAIHIDNTARPQIVHPDRNPRFHGILKAYYDLTGVASMINTSFNMHEEPIVATPDDAIRSFLQGHLDVLVLGNCILTP